MSQTTDNEQAGDYNFKDDVKWYQSPFNCQFGRFTAFAFEFPDGREHLAMVKGSPDTADLPLVRVQSSCLTGTAFLAHLCDCRQQLHLAMERVATEDAGVILYMDQEGRGHGLVEKLAQLKLINTGLDTLEAAVARGYGPDPRTYEQAAFVLDVLVGAGRPIRLLSNNPTKMGGLRANGVVIGEDVRLETEPTPTNFHYLRVKQEKMGHILPSLRSPAGIQEMANSV
ncbi:MAG TPA: GTP cyclohydrolase II [Acidimicrobiales bacterium]|nr:GTP cyclohydrolase II [Acidimicrobiales bacterium]